MARSIRPLHDRVLIQRIEEEQQARGGIIIPDTAKEKPQRGKVIATGDGKINEDGTRRPLDVKPGDQVLFQSVTLCAAECDLNRQPAADN